MGSGTSQLHEVLPFFQSLTTDESVHTLLTSEITSLTYDEFKSLIGQLNHLLQNVYENKGKQLIFCVKKGTDSTVFWKATVQIACIKVDLKTQKIDPHSIRLLSLAQFLKVFKTLKCQFTAAQQSSKNSETTSGINVSNIFDEVDSLGSSTDKQNECCICLERKQEVILPCTHSYCLPCLEEWNECHDTCPICREKFDGSDDTWVLSEVPNAEEISKEIHENLLELTQTNINASSSSSSSD